MPHKETKKREPNHLLAIVVAVLLLCTFLCFIFSLVIGRFGMSLSECINALATHDISSNTGKIIYYIRLRRSLAALIIGMALSAAGTTYQNVFNNKLVSPDILGVTSGASAGAAVAILVGASRLVIGVSAFTAGILSVMAALIIPRLINSSSRLSLVLSGVIVGSFMNSCIGLLKYVADKNDRLSTITFWIMGSIVDVTYDEIWRILPLVLLTIILLVLMSWRLNIISQGKEFAVSLGVNYTLNRNVFICCATVLTALAVSISGSIGWVGLVVPHIARAIVGSDNRRVLPVATLLGGMFMIIVDVLARTLSVNEIPLSIITGFLGTAVYVAVLKVTAKGNGSGGFGD